MNPKLHFDQNLLRILYIRYKVYLLPVSVIVLSVILFLSFVLPQFEIYLNNHDEVVTDEQTIKDLNQNILTLATLQQNDIAQNLAVANAALPSEKDYTGILNAISQAASLANVSLGDYSFQVGDVFSKQSSPASDGQLSVDVTLSISGDVNSAQQFINLLNNELPLSEVVSLSSRGGGGSEVKATFFYNPLPSVAFSPAFPIPLLSTKQQVLLTSLKKDFKNPQDIPLTKNPTATESAQTQ
jgi:hypothetical protein